MADGPRDDVAAAMQVAVALLIGPQDFGDIAGHGGLFGDDGDGGVGGVQGESLIVSSRIQKR